jgi:hypothetical protein
MIKSMILFIDNRKISTGCMLNVLVDGKISSSLIGMYSIFDCSTGWASSAKLFAYEVPVYC